MSLLVGFLVGLALRRLLDMQGASLLGLFLAYQQIVFASSFARMLARMCCSVLNCEEVWLESGGGTVTLVS